MILWLALAVVAASPQDPPQTPAPAPTSDTVPAWAQLNPYGYERQQCSPLVRPHGETLRACKDRIRHLLADEAAPPAGTEPPPPHDQTPSVANGPAPGQTVPQETQP